MNIHQLHSSRRRSSYNCTPCETSPHPETERYWPRVHMCRSRAADHTDERLSIEIINPWPELVLRHVKIAFISTGPNNHLNNGQPVVKFAPAHGIEFGDIAYSSEQEEKGVIRDIIMMENQRAREGRQFYAGVCFDACSAKTGEVKHYGYLLFRSNMLRAEIIDAATMHQAA